MPTSRLYDREFKCQGLARDFNNARALKHARDMPGTAAVLARLAQLVRLGQAVTVTLTTPTTRVCLQYWQIPLKTKQNKSLKHAEASQGQAVTGAPVVPRSQALHPVRTTQRAIEERIQRVIGRVLNRSVLVINCRVLVTVVDLPV